MNFLSICARFRYGCISTLNQRQSDDAPTIADLAYSGGVNGIPIAAWW